ncbi:Dihydroorotase [hydrothermal vent metagenome]|uniref:dihydroorotase n=1 Tax=hydrothermal vent metagenome TaxID=652676 RepID=A0A3B1E0A5_9ZZZZ
MQTITLYQPLDMHLHLRDDNMLKLVAPLSSRYFCGALIMPNLVPVVDTKDAVVSYRQRIMNAIKEDDFAPMMTLFFRLYTKEFLLDIKDKIQAIKLYPAGITTNSEDGVQSIDIIALAPTLNAMSEFNIPLCIHGETNGFVMDREVEFIPMYEKLAISFPKLKIVMEHITTKEAVSMVQKYDNLYATITLQHLFITLDDVAGGMLDPHLFCKPIAKRYEDRDALVQIATSGCEKIMFGSDSAPHPKSKKENCGCAAGVFTAPIALQMLTQLFEKEGKLNNLQKFISNNAINIYNLSPTKKSIVLEKKDFTIPNCYKLGKETVVPMYAGETIGWSIQ